MLSFEQVPLKLRITFGVMPEVKASTLMNTVTEPLAEDLIAGTYTDGDEIFVDISDVDDGLIFHKQTDLAIIK